MIEAAQTERIFQIPIAEIQVGDRHRHDMGDIRTLAASIDNLGLLHPILVTPECRLIAGQRRIQAAAHLGWSTVPARVVDLEDLLQAEHDENTERKDFTPTEAVAIGRELEVQREQQLKEWRRVNGLAFAAERLGNPDDLESVNRPPPIGDTRDVIGAKVGLSGPSYDRARRVVRAAEADPALFGDLPDLMDRTSIAGTHEELRRRRDGGKKPPPPMAPNAPLALASKRKPPQIVAERVIDMLDVAAKELAQLPLDALTQEGREHLLRQLNTTIPTLNKIRTNLKKEATDVA